jgi:two-component system, LytTR family, response regulator
MFETFAEDHFAELELNKPFHVPELERALNKVERLRGSSPSSVQFEKLFESLTTDYPNRIASRLGDRVCFIDLARVTHFYAEDKLTYAVADGKTYCVDQSITALEQRLNPRQFARIHRATLLNSEWVREASTFGGSLVVRLKDAQLTEFTVARNRISEVKKHLGL